MSSEAKVLARPDGGSTFFPGKVDEASQPYNWQARGYNGPMSVSSARQKFRYVSNSADICVIGRRFSIWMDRLGSIHRRQEGALRVRTLLTNICDEATISLISGLFYTRRVNLIAVGALHTAISRSNFV